MHTGVHSPSFLNSSYIYHERINYILKVKIRGILIVFSFIFYRAAICNRRQIHFCVSYIPRVA
jgi:hypothetical protein